MRRALLIVVALVALPAAAVLAGAGDDGHYRVRAIFDNAAFVVPGEDVKVAGVRVGEIESLHVTEDNRAAVVLDITHPGFQDFRADARCTIRPQSLIGEEFVECTPTQPRPPGSEEAPELRVIDDGEGEGQRLLPVERTGASVDLDLLGEMARLPQRKRLSIILNELGVGLAGRGEDLDAVLRRSAPALQELDKVLELLASQNRTLERLAVDSDTIMAPLARERRHVTGFISSSARVARATAERREALEASLQRLPRFLDELRPTMARLGSLAGEMTPVVRDLRASAPDIDELLRQMGPFSRAATPALERLGAVAEPGIPALRDSLPIVRDVRSLARQLRPVAATLDAVLVSFQRNDGIERAMDYFFYQAMAINGFDSIGHFLRAGLIVNTCSTYAVTLSVECSAKFSGESGSAATARAASLPMDEVLRRTAAVLRGADPDDVLPDGERRRASRRDRDRDGATGPAGRPQAPSPESAAGAPPTPASPAPDPTPQPPPGNPTEPLLEYLFGGDGP